MELEHLAKAGRMAPDQILLEIDATLEQLICNATTLQMADHSKLSEIEIAAFQKTQESLLQHLLYMDQLFETNSNHSRQSNKNSVAYKIQEKSNKLRKLNEEVNHTIRKTAKKIPISVKRRGKKLLKLLTPP